MTAELLREAAAKMRERAEDVAGRKIGKQSWIPVGNGIVAATLHDKATRLVAVEVMGSDLQEHLASFGHPAVALAVAKGFEELADEWDADEDVHPGGFHWTVYTAMSNAARAYLGRES